MSAVQCIETIDFSGFQIQVLPDEELVPIKPICVSIGIDWEGQRQRLSRQVWAGTCMIQAPSAGGPQDQVALPRQQVPMWLATIDASRIKDERAREVLELFQCRCAEVLDAYWNERKSVAELDVDLALKRAAKAIKVGAMTKAEAGAMAREAFRRAGMLPDVDSSERDRYARLMAGVTETTSAEFARLAWGVTNPNASHARRAATALRELGFVAHRVREGGSRKVRIWRREH
jgi:hypothetical protein